MANYFSITLDTTGPSNASISLAGGATYASELLITATIGCTDNPTTGYQMKLWGDVDTSHNTNIQSTEGASSWITYNTSQQIKLLAGDGSKTIYCLIRDDVRNESSQASDAILLDTTVPIVTIAGPDVSKISKVVGKNVVSFSFQSDSIFDEYKIKYVAASGNAHDTGTLIGTVGGSTNMSGTNGDYPASTAINCTIYGSDIETASSGDGTKIIKVFVKDKSGLWSI